MAMSESSDKEARPENRYVKKMLGIIRSHTHQERINTLFLRIKARLPKLEELARNLKEAEEDGIYRFYHGSNKVFFLQDPVKAAFTLIKEIGGEDDPPNFEYARIVGAGIAHQFSETINANWEVETKPILRTRVALCSGNHDDAGRLITADRAPVYEWFARLRDDPKITTDGSTQVIDNLIVTALPYHSSRPEKAMARPRAFNPDAAWWSVAGPSSRAAQCRSQRFW
jgi:hypothetical protein